jgi:NADPH:quinone reductase-like Zn-dependent oxidoreductase
MQSASLGQKLVVELDSPSPRTRTDPDHGAEYEGGHRHTLRSPDVIQVSEIPDPTQDRERSRSMSRAQRLDSLTSSYARGSTRTVKACPRRRPHTPPSERLRRRSPRPPRRGQPPYVPGLEVAGTVRELGDGVDGLTVGEPVVTLSRTGAKGGYAAVSLVDARFAVGLGSSGVDPALAVATVPNAATAYLALTQVAHLQPGETVLVHGALGGLASTFPGAARSLEASTTVGTVRPTSLPAAVDSGLPYDQVIASDQFPDALADERFDVVIDPVGGDLRTTRLDVMAPLGRLLAVGNASGDWRHSVDTNRLWVPNLAILGFSVGSYLPSHPMLARPAAEGAESHQRKPRQPSCRRPPARTSPRGAPPDRSRDR